MKDDFPDNGYDRLEKVEREISIIYDRLIDLAKTTWINRWFVRSDVASRLVIIGLLIAIIIMEHL